MQNGHYSPQGSQPRSPRSARGRSSPRSPGAGDMKRALVMSGWERQYQSINGKYEPRGSTNGHPSWLNIDNSNCIYHTGVSRWVVSRDFGDGSSCYAYLEDDGSASPATCSAAWVYGNDQGQWVENRSIRVSETVVSDDPLVQLRFAAEDEMDKAHMHDYADRQKMWQRIDRNGDGSADLAEVQALIEDLCKTGVWPRWLNNEQALQRAFKKTLEDSIDGDDKVEQPEFHDLLLNIFWFGKIHEVFEEIDTEDDHTVDQREFDAGMAKLGFRLPQAQLISDFRSIDKSGDEYVDFGEFCLYVRSKVHPEQGSSGKGTHDRKKIQCHEKIRLECGQGATTGVMVKKKAWGDFDKLEAKIQKLVQEPGNAGLKKLWRNLDYNGNNVVSLAETDKMVVETYPMLNHKPALMRAQQATLKAGGGHDFVKKKDFKLLLTNLFYYNKLFWIFDQADDGHDRRMDFKEFQFMMTMCGMKLSPAKAKSEFDKVDLNHGGQILFDEFCKYFVEKKCPDGLTTWIGDE